MTLDRYMYEVVKGLVERDDAVRVDVEQGEVSLLLHVSVDVKDLGKLIGKKGRTARALRHLLMAASHKAGTPCRLNLVGGPPETEGFHD